MKSIALGLIAVATLALPTAATHATRAGSARTGTVVRVTTARRTTALLLRGAHGLFEVRSAVLSADRHPLSTRSVRTGDHVAVRAGQAAVDLSQRMKHIHGVASIQAGPASISLVIGNVVISAGIHTPYTDRTHQTAHINDIMDGDQLIAAGMLDRQLGEMTQVSSIERVGPVVHGTSGGGR